MHCSCPMNSARGAGKKKKRHRHETRETGIQTDTKCGKLDTEMLPPRKPMLFYNSRTSNQQTRLSRKTKISRQHHYRCEGNIHEIHCSLICEM